MAESAGTGRRRAIVFDLDGTLLDTLQDLADSVNAVLASLGCPAHPPDAYRLFVGDGMTNLALRALPGGWESRESEDPGFLERCVSAVNREYATRWTSHTAPYPGIPELLDELKKLGVSVGVLSNKPHEFTTRMVHHFLGRWRFALVLGARDGVPRKPDPTAVREILAAMDAGQGDALYVGDSGTDMDTARAAGMEAVGVLWGFRTEEELRRHGATHIVSRPAEIPALL